MSREIQIFANEIQIYVFFGTINYFQSSGFTPTRTFLYLQQFLWPLYLSTDFTVILFIWIFFLSGKAILVLHAHNFKPLKFTELKKSSKLKYVRKQTFGHSFLIISTIHICRIDLTYCKIIYHEIWEGFSFPFLFQTSLSRTSLSRTNSLIPYEFETKRDLL